MGLGGEFFKVGRPSAKDIDEMRDEIGRWWQQMGPSPKGEDAPDVPSPNTYAG